MMANKRKETNEPFNPGKSRSDMQKDLWKAYLEAVLTWQDKHAAITKKFKKRIQAARSQDILEMMVEQNQNQVEMMDKMAKAFMPLINEYLKAR